MDCGLRLKSSHAQAEEGPREALRAAGEGGEAAGCDGGGCRFDGEDSGGGDFGVGCCGVGYCSERADRPIVGEVVPESTG